MTDQTAAATFLPTPPLPLSDNVPNQAQPTARQPSPFISPARRGRHGQYTERATKHKTAIHLPYNGTIDVSTSERAHTTSCSANTRTVQAIPMATAGRKIPNLVDKFTTNALPTLSLPPLQLSAGFVTIIRSAEHKTVQMTTVVDTMPGVTTPVEGGKEAFAPKPGAKQTKKRAVRAGAGTRAKWRRCAGE